MKNIILKLALCLIFILSFFASSFVHAEAADSAGNVNITAIVEVQKLEIINIHVINITDSSAEMRWQTNKPAKCVFSYGKNESLGNSIAETVPKVEHLLSLFELDSDTEYFYQLSCIDVEGDKAQTDVLTFKTQKEIAPIPPSEEAAGTAGTVDKNIFSGFAESGIFQLLFPLLIILSVFLTIFAMELATWGNLPLVSFLDLMTSYLFYVNKKKWGIVYDAESHVGIPNVEVDLYNKETGKFLETTHTDRLGRYGFRVRDGKYYIIAQKNNYSYPSKITHADYHKEKFVIFEDKFSALNIPMDVNYEHAVKNLDTMVSVGEIVESLRIPILIMGSLVAVVFYLAEASLYHLLPICLYSVIWIYEFYHAQNAKTSGSVFAGDKKTPVGHTIVRIFDEKTGGLVSTKISDHLGHFVLYVKSGTYTIEACHTGFKPTVLKNVYLERGKMLDEKIYLKKL